MLFRSEFRERITDADQFKVEESVFDEATYGALYKLVQDGYIEAFGGPLSTGKEANVYEALAGPAASETLEAGVRVPTPIAVERNVLVMEYIGTAAGRAKRLSEVEIENPRTAFGVVREYMRRLYQAGLVHGDLSEYNVVFHEGQLVVIDLGQAMTVHHPNHTDFLERDCENVAAFFARQGLDVSGDQLYDAVTGGE